MAKAASVNFLSQLWQEEAHKSSSKKCCVCVDIYKNAKWEKSLCCLAMTHMYVYCAYIFSIAMIHERVLDLGEGYLA